MNCSRPFVLDYKRKRQSRGAANATRGNVYTVHTNKYIEHVNQQQACEKKR